MSGSLARGKRLKTVRLMAGLTRNALEKHHGVSASTIQSWEAAKAGGLTERGVQRVIPIFRQKGVFCTPDWLLYGIGAPPQPTTNLSVPQEVENLPEYSSMPEDKAIIRELLTFRELNPGVIDHLIADDGMEPYYCRNDYVGGKRRVGEDINQLIGYDCIVETINNEFLLRRLKAGSTPDVYTLLCTNPDTTVKTPTLYDVELISVAPVIWHRRHDPA